jgi:hypothetical protein
MCIFSKVGDPIKVEGTIERGDYPAKFRYSLSILSNTLEETLPLDYRCISII